MPSFQEFLTERFAAAGFSTEDVLASYLPLARQVVEGHAAGKVSPLAGLADLNVEGVRIWFEQAKLAPPASNQPKLRELEEPQREALRVVEEHRAAGDGHGPVESLLVGRRGEPVTRWVYLPGYVSWEHEIGQHDPLTDVFSLGMILASMACRLDFNDPEDLRKFVAHRRNPFALAAQLHPVLAQAIVRMTELDRHLRPPDMARVLRSLENYRDQSIDIDIDLARVDGFASKDLKAKHQVVLDKLQQRLFEISKRNRLLQFKATLQTVNLTHASVPLSYDPRNIRPDQILVWGRPLHDEVISGKPLSLNKHLNFAEALYLPSVLDKIRAEAKRDQAEYGFAQLRLVAAFLRWTNLKATPPERFDSPLVLIAVDLVKKKGVRDTYQLELVSTEAEINPVVRRQFKQLYDIDLPETIDLEKTDLDALFDFLAKSIRASEPAVLLNKIDRPRIDLVHDRARRRLDQYQRAARISGRGVRNFLDLDYSYDAANYHPLGLRLFSAYVRPAGSRLRDIVETQPRPRSFIVPPAEAPAADEKQKQFFTIREGEAENPYTWEFDLCSVTLGNFKYRKMSLVRDYTALVEQDAPHEAFDSVFSLVPRPLERTPLAPPPLAERFHVVACDPTQAAAVARAKTEASYIIQGPPGTGKSQTITNLIADYLVRGKRVLFVCEKRAAIDVVYIRLRQQGLQELCSLIHDSQADKKTFIMDLKQTYETFLENSKEHQGIDARRRDVLAAIDLELTPIAGNQEAMLSVPPTAGLPLRELLLRAIELRDRLPRLAPLEQERLPPYAAWQANRARIERLGTLLAEVQPDGILAHHPLRLLSPQLAKTERPMERILGGVQRTDASLRRVEAALVATGEPRDQWPTIAQARTLVEYAVRVASLAEAQQMALLDPHSELTAELAAGAVEVKRARAAITEASQRTVAWKRKLAPEEVPAALEQAKRFEASSWSWFLPARWKLRSIMTRCYDFHKHVIKPSWSQVLAGLQAEYQAIAAHAAAEAKIRERFGFAGSAEQFIDRLAALRDSLAKLPENVAPLHARLLAGQTEPRAVEALIAVGPLLDELEAACREFLDGYADRTFAELQADLTQIQTGLNDLPDFLPCLGELAALPPDLAAALCRLPLERVQIEAALADHSLTEYLRANPAVGRFTAQARDKHVARLEERIAEWMQVNAQYVREHARQTFRENVRIASQPAGANEQPELKEFKKRYGNGRRELEHEFGKSMRYKSIRDLVSSDSGLVIRDLKPVWLMSPLSVSDTLPLDTDHFDVVIFDEASQITLEESIPTVFRARQAIVVGDEMQLPPTNFFNAKRSEEDDELQVDDGEEVVEYELSGNSLLNHAARNLASTMLGWHYRSRSESLISFSNWAFYGGRLLTVPEEQVATKNQAELRAESPAAGAENVQALLARPVSFHFMEHGIYEKRKNRSEADYIAQLVRGLIRGRDAAEGAAGKVPCFSIGIVAFSEAQQGEIENALDRLGEEDALFREKLEVEYEREEDGQFVGLLVKNLENIQGDERDIIIMSVCYGFQRDGRMLMNFGPINVSGGEKRLNVAFSRAKQHMALVSSIQYTDIHNEFNDGAKCLKNYLRYAAAASIGNRAAAEQVLHEMAAWRGSVEPVAAAAADLVANQLAAVLRQRGFVVELGIGQSHFRCDLGVRREGDNEYQLGILLDTAAYYAQQDLLERDMMKPKLLRAFGWRIAVVFAKDWYQDAPAVVERLVALLAEKP